MTHPTYEFKPLKKDAEWGFSNGENLTLPKGSNILMYQVHKEIGRIFIYPKKKNEREERGLGELSLDISILGELEEKIKELSS